MTIFVSRKLYKSPPHIMFVYKSQKRTIDIFFLPLYNWHIKGERLWKH